MGNTSHVATDSMNRVYVYQRQDPPVLVFDGDGNFLTSWGSGELLDAHGIYISAEGEVYLVDRDAHEVVKFNVAGDSSLRIGQRGRPSLQAPFNHPADIVVAPGGDIFVADGYGNSSVHRFSADGRHKLSWGVSLGAALANSPLPTAYGWTRQNGSTYATGKTTGCRYSASPGNT